MFFRSMDSKDIHVAAGMFNKPVKLKTEMNIFVKKKLEYYKLDNRLPKFNKYPKNINDIYK